MVKIYVDLDGVLTDFDKKLCETLEKPLDRSLEPGNDPKVWKKIDDAGEDFWATMEWMPDGKEMWEELKRHNPTILTAPSRHESSIEGKKKWLEKNIPGVPFIIEEKKDKYAAPDAILIDDREKNINAWEKAGGTGILHKDIDDTLKKLKGLKTMNKKLACLSSVVKKAALGILGGKYDKRFEEFLQDYHSQDSDKRKRYSPSSLNNQRRTPALFGIDKGKKRLFYNALGDRFGLAAYLKSNPMGGLNREPLSNLQQIILDMQRAEDQRMDEQDIQKLRKDLRDKALSVFPAGHPRESLNQEIATLVLKLLNDDEYSDLKQTADAVNPLSPAKKKLASIVNKLKGFLYAL